MPHLLLARGFGLTTWPIAKVGSHAIKQDETSAFLGACWFIRLEKTPDAIREQRGASIGRHWTPLVQFTRAIISRGSNAERHTVMKFGGCIA